MKHKSPITIADFLRLSVIFPFILFFLGIAVAIISSEVAWILIGVSVALLGGFQLFTVISAILKELKISYNQSPPYSDKKNFTRSYEVKEQKKDDNGDKDEYFRVINKNINKDEPDNIVEKKDTQYKNIANKNSANISTEIKYSDDNLRKAKKIIKTEEPNNHQTDDVSDTISEATEKPFEKTGETNKAAIDNEEIVKDNNNYTNIKVSMESFKELLNTDFNIEFKPKQELEYMLSKLLVILSSITDTKTAIFALVDLQENEYIIESYVTTNPEQISENNRFKFSNDLISQIIINQKPEILNDINPDAENDLIKYYKEKTGTKSFVGVPVFYNKSIIGVLCVDSNSNDAYDEIIINLISDFKNLFTSFVSNYNDKYSLYQDRKALYALEKFTHIIQTREDSQDNIIDGLIAAVAQVSDFERIGICGFNETENTWNIIALKDDKYNDLGKKADTKNSLIATTLDNYEPMYKKITKDCGIRIHSEEPVFEQGFFISLPLRSKTNNFGALFAESNKPDYLNESDLNTLSRIAEFAAISVERLSMLDLLNTSTMLDHITGLYNQNAFYHRMKEEIVRSKDFNYNVSLALLRIDKYETYEQHPEKFDTITANVIQTIVKNLRLYDILGKADTDIFGILLINMDSSKSQFWAEKIRNEIANSMISINSQRFSVTVSIGISQLTVGNDSGAITNNALNALNKSLDKSNTVTIY